MRQFLSIFAATILMACSGSEVDWDATGTFEATEITVSAEGTGRLVSFTAVQGDTVLAGDLLGLVDTVQLHLAKCQGEASRSGAVARRQDIAKQIAATEQQIVWQRSEQLRFEKLLAANAATEKQVEDIVNQIAVLQKQLAAQLSSLERGNASISDEGRAIELQIRQIEDQLKKCYIYSPISGTILTTYAEQDEFTATGKPLFTVADMSRVYLRAYITADMLTKVKLGQQVKVYSDFGADEQREYDGRVEWIASTSEFTPKTIQTRDERASLVYAVKIAVQNDGYLKIGMYGQMKL